MIAFVSQTVIVLEVNVVEIMCASIPTVADDVIQILTVLGLNIAVKGDFTLMYVVEVVLLRNATKIRTVQLLMNVVTPITNV